jgi:hypothetical protein
MTTPAWDLTNLPRLPEAACKYQDPTMWEIPANATRLSGDNITALKVCESCPTRAACARTPGIIRSNVILGGVAYDGSGRVMATVPGVAA